MHAIVRHKTATMSNSQRGKKVAVKLLNRYCDCTARQSVDIYAGSSRLERGDNAALVVEAALPSAGKQYRSPNTSRGTTASALAPVSLSDGHLDSGISARTKVSARTVHSRIFVAYLELRLLLSA